MKNSREGFNKSRDASSTAAVKGKAQKPASSSIPDRQAKALQQHIARVGKSNKLTQNIPTNVSAAAKTVPARPVVVPQEPLPPRKAPKKLWPEEDIRQVEHPRKTADAPARPTHDSYWDRKFAGLATTTKQYAASTAPSARHAYLKKGPVDTASAAASANVIAGLKQVKTRKLEQVKAKPAGKAAVAALLEVYPEAVGKEGGPCVICHRGRSPQWRLGSLLGCWANQPMCNRCHTHEARYPDQRMKQIFLEEGAARRLNDECLAAVCSHTGQAVATAAFATASENLTRAHSTSSTASAQTASRQAHSPADTTRLDALVDVAMHNSSDEDFDMLTQCEDFVMLVETAVQSQSPASSSTPLAAQSAATEVAFHNPLFQQQPKRQTVAAGRKRAAADDWDQFVTKRQRRAAATGGSCQ